MAEIIKLEAGAVADRQDDNNMLEATENMLTDIRSVTSDKQVRSVPIGLQGRTRGVCQKDHGVYEGYLSHCHQ